MALLEVEAKRLALVLDDYDNVTATLEAGGETGGFKLVVTDHRFDLDYEIASHYDYWNFVGALVDHKQYLALPLQRAAA